MFMLKCTGPSNRNKNYLHVCGLSMLLSISCTLLYWSFRRSYEAVMQSQAHQALPLAPAWHARGRSREHPMPDRNHTVPCGFYKGNQILLSHLQMGFWRLQSLPERSQSWKETSKSLSIRSTMYSSLLMERTVGLCQLEAWPPSMAQQLLCQTPAGSQASPGRDRHTCIFHRASCKGS